MWVDVWICGCVWMCGGVGVWMCGCVGVGGRVNVWVCVNVRMCRCVDVWMCGCGWTCEFVGVWTCGCVDVGVTLALAIKNSRAAIELQLHRKVHLHAPFTSK